MVDSTTYTDVNGHLVTTGTHAAIVASNQDALGIFTSLGLVDLQNSNFTRIVEPVSDGPVELIDIYRLLKHTMIDKFWNERSIQKEDYNYLKYLMEMNTAISTVHDKFISSVKTITDDDTYPRYDTASYYEQLDNYNYLFHEVLKKEAKNYLGEGFPSKETLKGKTAASSPDPVVTYHADGTVSVTVPASEDAHSKFAYQKRQENSLLDEGGTTELASNKHDSITVRYKREENGGPPTVIEISGSNPSTNTGKTSKKTPVSSLTNQSKEHFKGLRKKFHTVLDKRREPLKVIRLTSLEKNNKQKDTAIAELAAIMQANRDTLQPPRQAETAVPTAVTEAVAKNIIYFSQLPYNKQGTQISNEDDIVAIIARVHCELYMLEAIGNESSLRSGLNQYKEFLDEVPDLDSIDTHMLGNTDISTYIKGLIRTSLQHQTANIPDGFRIDDGFIDSIISDIKEKYKIKLSKEEVQQYGSINRLASLVKTRINTALLDKAKALANSLKTKRALAAGEAPVVVRIDTVAAAGTVNLSEDAAELGEAETKESEAEIKESKEEPAAMTALRILLQNNKGQGSECFSIMCSNEDEPLDHNFNPYDHENIQLLSYLTGSKYVTPFGIAGCKSAIDRKSLHAAGAKATQDPEVQAALTKFNENPNKRTLNSLKATYKARLGSYYAPEYLDAATDGRTPKGDWHSPFFLDLMSKLGAPIKDTNAMAPLIEETPKIIDPLTDGKDKTNYAIFVPIVLMTIIGSAIYSEALNCDSLMRRTPDYLQSLHSPGFIATAHALTPVAPLIWGIQSFIRVYDDIMSGRSNRYTGLDLVWATSMGVLSTGSIMAAAGNTTAVVAGTFGVAAITPIVISATICAQQSYEASKALRQGRKMRAVGHLLFAASGALTLTLSVCAIASVGLLATLGGPFTIAVACCVVVGAGLYLRDKKQSVAGLAKDKLTNSLKSLNESKGDVELGAQSTYGIDTKNILEKLDKKKYNSLSSLIDNCSDYSDEEIDKEVKKLLDYSSDGPLGVEQQRSSAIMVGDGDLENALLGEDSDDVTKLITAIQAKNNRINKRINNDKQLLGLINDLIKLDAIDAIKDILDAGDRHSNLCTEDRPSSVSRASTVEAGHSTPTGNPYELLVSGVEKGLCTDSVALRLIRKLAEDEQEDSELFKSLQGAKTFEECRAVIEGQNGSRLSSDSQPPTSGCMPSMLGCFGGGSQQQAAASGGDYATVGRGQ